jgi:hypothetical protein
MNFDIRFQFPTYPRAKNISEFCLSFYIFCGLVGTVGGTGNQQSIVPFASWRHWWIASQGSGQIVVATAFASQPLANSSFKDFAGFVG